jgi:hypothetical protein
VNVSERVAVLVTDSVVRVMIGDRFERREEFLEGLDEAIKITSGFNLSDLFLPSRLARLVGGTARQAEANHRKNFELMDCAIKQHEQRRAAIAAAARGRRRGRGGPGGRAPEDSDGRWPRGAPPSPWESSRLSS